MAEHSPTGGIKISSSGDTTPEYNAVRKSYGEINPAIIPGDFVNEAHSCGLIPTRNPSRDQPLDVVLKEISRDPVNYYSLQNVVATLNVEKRFDKGTGKMENAFQLEMRKYISAGSSEDPKVEPDNYPKVFISFSRRKVYDDSPDAYAEAKDLYAKLEIQGYKPWMDERGLEYGDVLVKEIFWAIKQCDFIILIMTGGYATSLWCLRELYYAALQKDHKKTIIPMLLEDEAVIGDQKAGEWLLRIGTQQKYFKPTEEEKAAMFKSLKDKMQKKLPHPSNDIKQLEDESVRQRKRPAEESRTDTDDADSGNYDSVSNHPHNRDEPRPYFLTIITSCIGVCIICFFIGIVLHQWKPAIVCHEIFTNDLIELAEIISSHGSAKQWCTYLGISESTCNRLDYSHQHQDDIVLDVAKAYLDENLNPCWEDIVHVLCRNFLKSKAALKLSEKHSVNYSRQCG